MQNGKSELGVEGVYRTRGGVTVHRSRRPVDYEDAIAPIVEALDERHGMLLASSFEFPGRYTRWDIGFVDPPLAVTARGRAFRIEALNARGGVLLPALADAVRREAAVTELDARADALSGRVDEAGEAFAEEQRSRQPSVFSLLRIIAWFFGAAADPYLGLYGAFGYDLAFQFEPIILSLPRRLDQRDLVLYLPDSILVVDHRREAADWLDFDFFVDGRSTEGLPREGKTAPYRPSSSAVAACDHEPGAYAAGVRRAREAFRRGDLFEVVPGQTFSEPCPAPPSEVFRRLRRRNPAPYGALMNLGEGEYLIAASPEMFVRVEGRRIETCPISGTAARGADAIGDAAQILGLLNSKKDESELTMCTDVDRNDKARVCEPGSVRIIGRRQIEMYSRLIHTVDHVEGTLRPEFDALDGFLAHAWAVTVTGAPKRAAMQFIEDGERSPRLWYGGAIGFVGFNGSMNTGLTLRTVRIKDGVAQVRAGATLLFESDPEAEEAETRLKAAALLDAIRRPTPAEASATADTARPGAGRKILVVDHQDSFVHNLAGYFRNTGADVVTLRAGFPTRRFRDEDPDLVVLSPGPGRPEDFHLSETIAACIDAGLPIFGVCLGLQGVVEYFGGRLGVLPSPVHGKATKIRILGGRLFDGLPREFSAGRYHSLYAIREHLPADLDATALAADGVVMAVEHTDLPIAAVQFHPESLMTLDGQVGEKLVANAVERLACATREACSVPT